MYRQTWAHTDGEEETWDSADTGRTSGILPGQGDLVYCFPATYRSKIFPSLAGCIRTQLLLRGGAGLDG